MGTLIADKALHGFAPGLVESSALSLVKVSTCRFLLPKMAPPPGFLSQTRGSSALGRAFSGAWSLLSSMWGR